MARIEVGRLTLAVEPVNCGELFAEALFALAADRRGARASRCADIECGWAVAADRQRLASGAAEPAFQRDQVQPRRRHRDAGVPAQEDLLRIAVTRYGPGHSGRRSWSILFKPFERLEPHPTSIEGIGLGLAISKRLVQLMGGEVGVESIVGKGSTFWLTLPLSDQATAEPAPELSEPAAQQIAALGPCTVLYIEDNLANLKVVERILARQPAVQLLAATHGQPGLELAIRHQPSLILLDLHLPDLHGTRVLARLRAEPRTAVDPRGDHQRRYAGDQYAQRRPGSDSGLPEQAARRGEVRRDAL